MQTFIAFQRRDEKIPREIPKLREDYCKLAGGGGMSPTLSHLLKCHSERT